MCMRLPYLNIDWKNRSPFTEWVKPYNTINVSSDKEPYVFDKQLPIILKHEINVSLCIIYKTWSWTYLYHLSLDMIQNKVIGLLAFFNKDKFLPEDVQYSKRQVIL